MFRKFAVIILVLIISQLTGKPFKDITSMAQLDSMSVFSFAIMSDNKGDALNKKEFERMDKWIKETKSEFVIGLGDHVKRSWKNQFVDFLKEDKWWYTHFYPVLADGENEYYGKSQADRSKGKMLFDLTDMKERGKIEFTEEGSEYYAKIKVRDYTIHLISLFYPDSPSDDRLAFPDESKKYLVDVLNSIDKKDKDIIIAAAHSRMGYWLNNLPGDQLDVVLNKVDLVLSATTHVFQVFNSYGDEIVPLAINTGSITFPNLFCPGGYVQVNIVENPAALVVQYINAEKKDRKLSNTYYSAVKLLNGAVVSADFKELKRKDDPNRIVAKTSKEFSTEELKALLQSYSMEKFKTDTAIINNFRGLNKGDINYIDYLKVFPYKNKIVALSVSPAEYDSIFTAKTTKEVTKLTTDAYTGDYILKVLNMDESKIEKTDFDEMKILKEFMKKSDDIKYIDD